ncbi:MAG: Asp-tRNA(Asn)/Glu-tRNA(Gln) amidotransferase subunit GatC [Candidatus Omnitrophota bacterium]
MAISKKDLIHVAYLCRIGLDEAELDSLTKELEKIIEYIDQLKKVDIKNTSPTSHVLPLKNVYREDKTIPSLDPKEVLQNAPFKKDNFFKVPKVIE